jgi:hypothetical protein
MKSSDPTGAGRERSARAPFAALVALTVVTSPVFGQEVPSEPIATGQTVTGTLSATDPILEDSSHYHLYRFDAAPGERVIITLRSADFDAYLSLGRFGKEGFEIFAFDDDGGGGTDARIVWAAPAGGTVLIRANSLMAGEVGDYQLTLEPAPATVARDPEPIRMGATVRGSLGLTDPTDEDGAHYHPYLVHAAAGDWVLVTMRSEDFDAYLHLGRRTAEGFESLASDDDSGGGTDARLRWMAEEAGEYLVLASSWGAASTGAYTLTVEAGTPPTPITEDEARALRPGEVVEAAIDGSDPLHEDGRHYHIYRFDAGRGDAFVVTLRSADFDAFLVLGWVHEGRFLELATDDDGAGGTDARLEWTAPGAGTYLVRATSLHPGRTGAYSLTFDLRR